MRDDLGERLVSIARLLFEWTYAEDVIDVSVGVHRLGDGLVRPSADLAETVTLFPRSLHAMNVAW